jgi:hypothetical protein
MARLFSIDFIFKEQPYTALVTAGAAPDGVTHYKISPNDEQLKHLLPGGSISFSTLSDLQPLAEKQPRMHELMNCMALALFQKVAPPVTEAGKLQQHTK